jgi:hypothetical protein
MDSVPVVPGDTLLYKFRSLDTEQNVKFAADILLNHRLFAAPPKSFNDPFDCDAPYCFDATEAEKIERAIARIKKENPLIGDEEARRLAPSRCLALEEGGPARIRSFVETELGVVSLAANIDNALLWAHYASGHTGIAIEFCASDLRHAEFFGNALPVVYQLERPVVNFYRDEFTEKVHKLLLTKSQDWAYEREWRIIVQNRQKQPYIYFDPAVLRAVYLGCRIADDRREVVRGWLCGRSSFPAPPLFQARPSDTKYGLVFEQLSTTDLV